MKTKTADYFELIKHLYEGYALHKMIFNEDGSPVDYEFIDVNDAFLAITGKKREEIVGKKASEILPWVKKAGKKAEAFKRYGKISKEGGEVTIDNSYFSAYDKWMNVTGFSTGDGYFITLARDRTIETTLKNSNQYTEERYHTILETVPVAIIEADVTSIIHQYRIEKERYGSFEEYYIAHPNFYEDARNRMLIKGVNNEAVRLFKSKSQEDLIKELPDLTVSKSRREWRRFFKGLWDERDVIELEVTFKDCNAEEMILFIRSKMLFLKDEFRVLVSMMNVTHIKQMEVEWEKQQIELQANYEQLEAYTQELREAQTDLSLVNVKIAQTNEILMNREKQLTLALKSAREALWILEEKSGQLENIGHWQEFLGYENHEIGSDLNQWLSLVHEEDQERLRMVLQTAFEKKEGFFEVEYRIKKKDDSYLWIISRGEVLFKDDGKTKMIFGTHQDISRRKEAEQKLDYVSSFDMLTGLPNRNFLMRKLDEELERTKRNNNIMAVVSLDLDGFKKINDSMGNVVGDQLLALVASRLRRHIRKQDFVARYGSDEFVMVFSDLKDKENITSLIRNLFKRFEQPFIVPDSEVFINISMGIAVFPGNGEKVQDLIQKAGFALMGAKRGGKNTFKFYTSKMNAKALKRLEMETKLHKAIERENFLLHYQPQFDLNTNTLVGIEALIRWNDPEKGLIAPSEFIPIAEESGLILQLGTWVLKQACLQMKKWKDLGLFGFRVSVNISPLQFSQENFLDILKQTIDETGVKASDLMLEITEGILMDDVEDTRKKLQVIKELGCKLSIDDFGTGYSSLAYLRKFPIDELKIDKSFVLDLAYPDNASIVKTIISLAENLNLNVIAEGIEDNVQKEFLLKNKCNMMQGYLFGHPESPEKIESFLKEFFGLA
ncbi:MAG TPA: EAL domain-containing protein [Thermotogota bacterium]|nr:EAL domain-containing protein [Thermotogota bacterium]